MWKRVKLRRAVVVYVGAAAFLVEVQASDRVHVARQATTATSAAPSLIPSPVLTFVGEDSYRPVVCQPVNLDWFYNGPADTITLTATNMGVSQARVPPSTGSSSALPSAGPDMTVAVSVVIDKINPTVSSYTWKQVTVPAGWYIINATMPSRSFSAASDPFYVLAGSDTSCLPSPTVSTSPSNSASPTSPSTSIWPVPTPLGGSSTNSTMIGAIVGACVGAVALVAVIFLIWLCYRRRRAAKANGSSSHPNVAHRFNGLSSVDSRNVPTGKVSSRSRHRHHTSSFGTSVIMNGSEEGIAAEKGSVHSKFDSPNPFGDHAGALSSLPVLSQQPNNGRTYSAASSIVNGVSPVDSSRNPLTSARESLESTTYPPTSPSATNRQLGQISTSSSSTPSHHQDPSPTSRSQSETPGDATKKAHRQSFGKKRKPVPVYDETHVPSPILSAPPVPYSPPSPSPTPDLYSASPSSSNLGHYSTRNRSAQDLAKPELAHKSSFGPGVQQMHYLIPDMPMPQKG